jgi:hypothetical protein
MGQYMYGWNGRGRQGGTGVRVRTMVPGLSGQRPGPVPDHVHVRVQRIACSRWSLRPRAPVSLCSACVRVRVCARARVCV